jgi:outer membrane protein TolC
MKQGFTAIAVAIFLTLMGPGYALADETVPGGSLDGLISILKERNPDYASTRHETRAATERVESAGALMAPRFKVEWEDITKGGERFPTVAPTEVGSTRYTLLQDLPWSGKRDLKREIAAQDVEAAQWKSRQTLAEIASRVKTVYAQRYLIHATQRLVNENLDLMLQLEKVMQVRYAGGLAAQQDITRIHVEHTGMRAELVTLAGELRVTQNRMNALLARQPDAPLALPTTLRRLPDPSKLHFSALSDRLPNVNSQIVVESTRVKSAEKTRELTYKNRYPDLTIGISAMQRQGAVNEWGLMLELNLPLQRDTLRAQERESEAMVAAAQSRQEAAIHQALADLYDNLTGLEVAQQTERLMTYSLMPQADLTWRAALAGYENGKTDFATLLDAQRQIRQARLGQLKAQVDAQMRLAEIEKLLGEDL